MMPGKHQRSKQDAKVYVGRSMAVHNLLFFAHTLCMNYVTNTSRVRSKELLESLGTDVLSHGRQPKVETSPLRRVLHPFSRKFQVVNAKTKALQLSGRTLKRAKSKNINFRLTSVAQKRLCFSSLLCFVHGHGQRRE